MKAMVCEAFGGPEVLALREVPDPGSPDTREMIGKAVLVS